MAGRQIDPIEILCHLFQLHFLPGLLFVNDLFKMMIMLLKVFEFKTLLLNLVRISRENVDDEQMRLYEEGLDHTSLDW